MHRASGDATQLKTPVVSIGGLTMGGVGKSPLVAHLAPRLRDAGRIRRFLRAGINANRRADMVIVARGPAAFN